MLAGASRHNFLLRPVRCLGDNRRDLAVQQQRMRRAGHRRPRVSATLYLAGSRSLSTSQTGLLSGSFSRRRIDRGRCQTAFLSCAVSRVRLGARDVLHGQRALVPGLKDACPRLASPASTRPGRWAAIACPWQVSSRPRHGMPIRPSRQTDRARALAEKTVSVSPWSPLPVGMNAEANREQSA